MFKYITVAALLATTSAESLRNRKNQGERKLIVNGQAASDRYPWFVQFDDNSCGGTLFDEQHVLTSATCVTPNAPAIVYIGANVRENPDGEAYEHEVECAIRHPDYDEETRKNDIAVIKLKRRCPIETVRLANDDLTDTDVNDGRKFWELGLGDTAEDNSGSYPSELQEAEMDLVTDAVCQEIWGDNQLELGHHVCVNFTTTKGYCSGDGGTPLLDDNRDGATQYGVATPPINSTACLFGGNNNGETGLYKCGDPEYPDVYADVAFFRDWIEQQVDASTDQCDSQPPCAFSFLGLLTSFLP